jgi:uncharacterized protein
MAHICLTSASLATDRQPIAPCQSLSIWNTVILHLFPGALITIFYFLAGPILIRAGFPPVLSLYLAILLVLIPFELGFLLYQGKKLNGRYSLEGVVLFRECTPGRQKILWIMIAFICSSLTFSLLPLLDSWIAQTFFAWLPGWSLPTNLFGSSSQYSQGALTVTIVAGFIINGVAGPIVEELYFRGYLLPRIPASKRWAPLINVSLFSLYHFFSPWQNLTRILAFLPLGYAVARKRNIEISIFAHCLLNIGGMVMMFAL